MDKKNTTGNQPVGRTVSNNHKRKRPEGRQFDDKPNLNRTVSLDTWQFVRVMVALEEQGRRGALWRQWSTTWKSVDEELTALGDTDFDAYSELMMRHRLELQLPTRAQKMELVAAIKHVVRQLNERLRAAGLAPSQRQDLEFESSELRNLARELEPDTTKSKLNTPQSTGDDKAHGKSGKHAPRTDLQRTQVADQRNAGGASSRKRRIKRARD